MTPTQPPLEPICEEVVQMRVEQMVLPVSHDYAETGADELIAVFSAGQLLGDARARAGTAHGAPDGPAGDQPLPAAQRAHLAAVIDDMRDYWRYILQGLGAPTFAITEVDWGNYDGLYPYTSNASPRNDPMVWGG